MSGYTGALSLREVFSLNAARFDETFRKAGAIYIGAEGLEFIDETKICPELLGAYQRFIQFGYVNGLMS